MTAKGVLFDLVAVQSPSYRRRGIARYSFELAKAVSERHPELVTAMVVHPELEDAEELAGLGRWLTSSPDWEAAGVVHLSSAFEPEVPVKLFWPPEVTRHGLLTAVTVYDLIPELFPGWYLQDPGLRRRWRAGREVVRAADLVFTISESTREDTVALLSMPEERVRVVGTGTASTFVPAASRQKALAAAKARVKGLKKGFLLYTGAFDPRKNVDNLVRGYAALPPRVIEHHQLVIACSAPPLTRNHYLVMARELGLRRDRVLIPGYVPERVLVALNQSAELAVFPSLYEGFGFPVVEALACGTPAIAGDNSSLREILPREARFQAQDPWAIAEAIERALYDASHRARLMALVRQPTPTWDDVADKAAEALEDLLRQAGRHPRSWRAKPRVALFGAPDALAEQLSPELVCDSFTWPPSSATAVVLTGAWQGGYDAVVLSPHGDGELGSAALRELATALPGRCLVLTGPATSPEVLAVVAELSLPSVDGDDEAAARAVLALARQQAA